MNHTIQQIINNQKENKEAIMNWFKNEIQSTKESLSEIKTSDPMIQKEKKKLESKFKKFKLFKHFEKLFFMHPTRNKTYYVWWDANSDEVLILRYEQA